jgi:hypothetical protein
MKNGEIADLLPSRVLVGSFYPHNVDTNLWFIWSGDGHNAPRRPYICTGYHSIWADELTTDFSANKHYAKFYKIKNTRKIVKMLESQYGITQIDAKPKINLKKIYCKIAKWRFTKLIKNQ